MTTRAALIHLTAHNVLSGPATTTDIIEALGVSRHSAKDRGDVLAMLREMERRGQVICGRCETRGLYTWTVTIGGTKRALKSMGLL